MSAAAAFIRAHTAVESPPLVPELRLHLATELTPLWEATESWLERHAVAPPYWAFAWAGGQALARYLLDNVRLVSGCDVLDFGCGSGLVAIAGARAGGTAAAADIDPLARAATALNAALNGAAVALVDGDVLDDGHGAAWGVVLAGDMFYERGLAERALPWLERQAQAGALVLLGDAGRAYMPKDRLVELARYTVPTSREIEDRETREGTVWRLLP